MKLRLRRPPAFSFARVLAPGATTAMLIAGSIGVAAATSKPPSVNGRYIVVLKDSTKHPGRVAKEHARAFGEQVGHVFSHALKGYSALIPNARLAALKRDHRVAFVSPDLPVHADAQSLPTGVNRIEGDQSSQRSGDRVYPSTGRVKVNVAVLDTGSGPHTDLRIVGGKNCVGGSGHNDGNGHGTHVAGIIGAKDNSDGVVGVAPGANIYSVKVLRSNGSGSWSTVICGIDWVTDTDAHPRILVANLSLGGPGQDDGNCGHTNNDALHQWICASVAAGTTYTVAAGNQNADIDDPAPNAFNDRVPAAYNEVLTVAAVADYNGRAGGGTGATCYPGQDDTVASFSNFARAGSADESHVIAAPGLCIRSTWKGGGYQTVSGTSMASPHAAGSVALCLNSKVCAPGSTPATLISKLRADAKAYSDSSLAAQLSDPNAVYYGFGGDPNSPVTQDGTTRYYGYVLYDAGY